MKIFERVLGERAIREFAFEFLRGDPTPKRLRGVPLRVDGFFPKHRLVVEFMGKQHFEHNLLMDRREGRREQRQRYQDRRTHLLALHGIPLIRIRYDEPLTEALVQEKLQGIGLVNSEL